MPSDSSFAIAMRTQQQADREEQQRIKSLVLNYEMSNEPETADSASETKRPAVTNNSNKADKSSGGRTSFRSRKLQLSDVNW